MGSTRIRRIVDAGCPFVGSVADEAVVASAGRRQGVGVGQTTLGAVGVGVVGLAAEPLAVHPGRVHPRSREHRIVAALGCDAVVVDLRL